MRHYDTLQLFHSTFTALWVVSHFYMNIVVLSYFAIYFLSFFSISTLFCIYYKICSFYWPNAYILLFKMIKWLIYFETDRWYIFSRAFLFKLFFLQKFISCHCYCNLCLSSAADKPHNPMINSGAIMTAALVKVGPPFHISSLLWFLFLYWLSRLILDSYSRNHACWNKWAWINFCLFKF